MAFFWVNLGTSYKEVAEHKFLWAPSYVIGSKGEKKTSAGWEPVKEIKKGDTIFCCREGNIIYVAIAIDNAYPAQRPQTRTFSKWNEDGWRADVDLTILAPSVSVQDFKPTLMDLHNQQCSPVLFTRAGGTSQQYMVPLPLGAGALINKYLGQAEEKVCERAEAIKGRKLKQGGTREVIAQARVGQGQFREDVLALWKNTCPVSGLGKAELLTASHIVPWCLSNETEKIDPNNGFPLSPALDKLFDRGYISFGDDGHLLIKESLLSSDDLKCLGVAADAKIHGLNAEQKKYLAQHRKLNHFEP